MSDKPDFLDENQEPALGRRGPSRRSVRAFSIVFIAFALIRGALWVVQLAGGKAGAGNGLIVGVLLLAGLGIGYWAWFRMPPDGEAPRRRGEPVGRRPWPPVVVWAVRVGATGGLLMMLVIFGFQAWSGYEESTWAETEGEVVSRMERGSSTYLGVWFDKHEPDENLALVLEWGTTHKVGDTVRIRYDPDASDGVHDGSLAEAPQSISLIWVLLFFQAMIALICAFLSYWAWRTPVSGATRQS
ncbi:hypothetical protein KIPE111705_24890 [Kibdelosporangium persicum]|uniref:DUF3592 domain-containing protein n=1 Tax=Kibdelosporangium persicum TaxID=2698649 RepID=A0ABX2FG32_9PSEU|nr:hypothetical protein [Kibdelosporangium persicum]NRN69857.1 hypothetical protein [Kibdelosporangium persicum]